MWEFFSRIFDPSGFPARWKCGPGWAESPWLGWTHVFTDLLTALAYFAVPCVVMYFVARSKQVKLPPAFYVMLTLIFVSCGIVHLTEATIFWWPIYRFSAMAKLLTALVSCAGVGLLFYVLPRALELKTPETLHREIAGRKRAEASYAIERNLLHTLMNHLPDAIYFKDRDGKFLRISKALADKFGIDDPEHAHGRRDADYFSAEHAELAQRDEERILETTEALIGLVEKETWPDGRETWVSTTKAPLRNEEGEIIGTFGISHDITRLKPKARCGPVKNDSPWPCGVRATAFGIGTYSRTKSIMRLDSRNCWATKIMRLPTRLKSFVRDCTRTISSGR
jgi:two-component system, sensor histidine kinase and response regulator